MGDLDIFADFFFRYRLRALVRRSVEFLAAAGALFGAMAIGCYIVELQWPVEDFSRLVAIAVFFCSVTLLLVRQVVVFAGEISLPRAARIVERCGGRDFKNGLVTAVQLSSESEVERYGYSKQLLAACAADAARKLQFVDMAKVIPLRGAAVLLICAAAAWLPLLLLVWRYPVEAKNFAASYLHGFSGGSSRMSVEFSVSPGDVSVPEGSVLEFSVGIVGYGLRFPVIRTYGMDGSINTISLVRDGNVFRGSTGRLFHSFRYRAESGSIRSKEFSVEVVEPPRLAGASLCYHYAKYTGLPPEQQTEGRLDVRAPPGTRVELSATATKTLTSAEIHYSYGKVDPLHVDGDRIKGTIRADKECEYRIVVFDERGFFDTDSPPYRIEPIPDTVPRVFILEPARDISMSPSEATTKIPVQFYVEDDFGVGGLRLCIRLRQRYEYTFTELEETRDIAMSGVGGTRITTSTVLDLTQAILNPGDSVAYSVEAWDLAPGPRKDRTGRSREFFIRIPYKTEAYKEVMDEQDTEIESLDQINKRQKSIDKRLNAVMEKLKKQGNLRWRDRRELEKVQARQKELRREAQNLAAKMKETIERAGRKDLLDEGTLHKLKEVQELMAQVADSRMKQMLERMQQLMSRSSFDKKLLEKMRKNFDRNKYTKELDRLLKTLRKLRAQQQFDRAIEKTREIIKRQEDLAKQTLERARQKKNAADLSAAQRKLAKSVEKQAELLEEAAQKLAVHYPDAAKQIAKEAGKMKSPDNPAQQMKMAAAKLASQKPAKALEMQHKAMNSLRESLDQLQETRARMKKKEISINVQALMKLLYRGLDLLSCQEQVLPPVDPVSGTAVQPMTKPARRAACKKSAAAADLVCVGVKAFERRFEKLFDDELMFKTAFLTIISELVESLESTKYCFEQVRYYSGARLAGQCYGKLSLLMLRLADLARQLKNQAKRQGSASFLEQMDELIKRQQRLNEMTRRQGARPKADPLLQQMFHQMMAEQMMIRRSLERLIEKSAKARKLERQLARLTKEMKDVEKRLSEFDASEQTRKTQNRIVTRMLEYSSSLHKQDYSKQRKSTAAKDLFAKPPPPVPGDLKEFERCVVRNLSRDGYPVEFRAVVERYLQGLSAGK